MSIMGQPPIREPLLTEISDATAEQWHVKTGKTAYIVGGKVTGTAYTPAMMQFDGTTGYYTNNTLSVSGNKVTLVAQVSHASFADATQHYAVRVRGGALGYERVQLSAIATNHAVTARQGCIQCQVQNSAGTVICRLVTAAGLLDGQNHTLLFSFDGDAGTAVLYVDGVNADDTGNADRVAPTTGTLGTTTPEIQIGAANATPVNLWSGQIGFCGYRDAHLTNWQDFMQADGTPKELDTIGWTEWNAGVSQTPMMTYDGSTGYYNKTTTTAGNKVTLVARVNVASRPAGTTSQYICRMAGTAAPRAAFVITDQNHATTEDRNTISFLVWNSAAAIITRLYSTEGVDMTGGEHTIFASYDGDAGTAVMYIDGVAEDASHTNRIAPAAATLSTGSSPQYVGGISLPTLYPDGDIGFVGYREAYLTNWSDFMEADGTPKEIDEIAWSQWGAQPLFWNKGGLMTDNKGSAGAMTKNGTITGPSGGWPLFWNHHGEMSNNLGSAGAATKNGVIVVGNGGNST